MSTTPSDEQSGFMPTPVKQPLKFDPEIVEADVYRATFASGEVNLIVAYSFAEAAKIADGFTQWDAENCDPNEIAGAVMSIELIPCNSVIMETSADVKP